MKTYCAREIRLIEDQLASLRITEATDLAGQYDGVFPAEL
jgi:hypothetical protein